MMVEESSVAEIKDFSRYYGTSTQRGQYLCWTPGSYTYLFTPDRRSVQFIRSRIGGPSPKRRLGQLFFDIASFSPATLRFVPSLSIVEVPAPTQFEFDVAIAGYRITLIDFDGTEVISIPIDREEPQRIHLMRSEIAFRQRIPESSQAPEMLDWDQSHPYIVEEYLDGTAITDPISDWKSILSAFRMLRPLYRQAPSELIPMETAVSDLKRAIDIRNMAKNQVIGSVVEALETIELPSSLRWSRVHGDFHTGNLLKTTNGIYILDWEDSTIDYAVGDFFKLLISYCIQIGDETILRDILQKRGTGWRFAQAYANEVGHLVFGSDEFSRGLVLFDLVRRIAANPEPECSELWPLLESAGACEL